jgi:hypothetical protein
MAATASVSIAGKIQGTATGDRTIGPISIASSNASPIVQTLVLQAGANTITPPTVPATSGCVIQLPSTNTSVVTLKGVTGDTGIAIGKTTTTVLNWDSAAAPTNFCLSSVSTQTGLVTEIAYF